MVDKEGQGRKEAGRGEREGRWQRENDPQVAQARMCYIQIFRFWRKCKVTLDHQGAMSDHM